jgi:hypothetical protein
MYCRKPPTSVATTGSPLAIASSTTLGELSNSDGSTKKSTDRYHSGIARVIDASGEDRLFGQPERRDADFERGRSGPSPTMSNRRFGRPRAAMDMASTARATFLIGTSRLATSATRLPSRPSAARRFGTVRTEDADVHALRYVLHRTSERGRQVFSGEAVGDDRVGQPQIGDIARIGHPRQVDHRRNRQRADARRGTQRMGMDDVRPLRRWAMRRQAARQNHSSSARSIFASTRPSPRVR